MTNFFRFLFFLTFLAYALLTNAAPPRPAKPVNYVVLLDLSDRILAPDQPRRDAALVQAVFSQFEQRVRQQLIINSADRFRVVIAPQRGINYRTEPYMDALYLDMSSTGMGQKRKRLDALKDDLPRQLTALYSKALVGRRQARDFAGCDLWQYANEQLPTDLDATYDNRLVVLTDGYFDFENNTRALRQGNRATDSRMLDQLRKDINWRQTLARSTEGLLPVVKALPALSVCVAEIRPKFDNLNEAELLITLWTKWLNEMNIRRSDCQQQSGLSKSTARLRAFLQT